MTDELRELEAALGWMRVVMDDPANPMGAVTRKQANRVWNAARAHLGCSTITDEQVNVEPVYWCSVHDSTTEGHGSCDAKRAWNYTSECRTQLVRIIPVVVARVGTEKE